MQLHNVTCTRPSIECVAEACRDSRSRHAGLYHRLSSLCLDQEGTSHAKTCPPQAAAWSRRWQQLTPRFFGPPWHPTGFFPQPRGHACPKTSSPGGAGVDKEGEWLRWQWAERAAPSWGCEKYPRWIIDSPEHRKSVHASDISPNLSCFATCPPKKRI